MRNLYQIIQATRRSCERVHVLWKRFPVPTNAFVQRSAWNIFHAFHELNQVIFMARTHWCKTDAAVPHHQGGHAVVNARGKTIVPRGLSVIVGVDVNKPGRDPQARGVDRFFRRLRDGAHLHNFSIAHAHISHIRLRTCSINDASVFKQPVEHLFFSKNRPAPCR